MREYEKKKIFFFLILIYQSRKIPWRMPFLRRPSSGQTLKKRISCQIFSFFYSHNLNKTDKLYVTLKITLFNF